MDSNLKASSIQWEAQQSHLLLNPKLDEEVRQRIHAAMLALPQLEGHLWLTTSGTTSVDQIQLVALAKSAFLAAARGANTHLLSTAEDRWLNVLPTHHVGGLSIYARAFLSGATVFDHQHDKWNPIRFVATVAQYHITLTSLVPTQVADLVAARSVCPPSLRAAVIGGGALSPELYLQARELNWPCLPSFGMTECCSQIATAELQSLTSRDVPRLKLLPHVEARIREGCLGLKSAACLTGWARISASEVVYADPKVDGWFQTRDRAQIDETRYLQPLGRNDELVKITGELVDVAAIEERLMTALRQRSPQARACVLALPDGRREHSLFFVLEQSSLGCAEAVVRDWNVQSVAAERIQALYFFNSLPLTDLGKIRRGELKKHLLSQWDR